MVKSMNNFNKTQDILKIYL